MIHHLKSASSRLLQWQHAGGLATIAIALVAWYSAQSLDFGSLAEIGPGLFPVALAIILLGLSLCLLGFEWFKRATPEEASTPTKLRPVVAIFLALAVFAFTIKGSDITPALGVTGATPLAILVAGFASAETRWRDLVIFAVVLTAFCALLFRFMLGLPLPLAPWLVGY